MRNQFDAPGRKPRRRLIARSLRMPFAVHGRGEA